MSGELFDASASSVLPFTVRQECGIILRII